MGLRRRGYAVENIQHRELPFGQKAAINLHRGTILTLERSPKKSEDPHRYKLAIEAHEKALKMYRSLKDEKGLTKAIRAAKKMAKEAHLLTRELQ